MTARERRKSSAESAGLRARAGRRSTADGHPVETVLRPADRRRTEPVDSSHAPPELRDAGRQHPQPDGAAVGGGGEAVGGRVAPEASVADGTSVQRAVGPDVAAELYLLQA